MTEGTSKSEDLWHPYKDLVQTLTLHLGGETKGLLPVETVLKKYKQNFFAILQNLPKNAKSREELKKGMEDGITVRGIGYQTLSKELYQETLIISDMYDLNEFVALDLLCTAQIQMSYHQDLPRGLVAILLYYDGRKALVTALRMLIQARRGIAWCLKITDDVEKYITSYTDQLAENGLFNKIFDLLRSLDLSKEIEKLQQNVALGGPKHRRQVTDLFTSIKVILADCVFLWSVHCGLSKNNTLSLINFLKEVKIEEDPTGKIDEVTLYLQAALLSALDLSVLHTREDGEEVVQSLPILAEPDFIPAVYSELTKGKSKWASEGLYALSIFGLGVCISSLKLLPQGQNYQQLIEQEEKVIEEAISNKKVFEFLIHVVMECDSFYTEEFVYRRFHNLFCDFISQMYSKIREYRIKSDEAARTIAVYASQGLDAPESLSKEFEMLLSTLSKMYSKDPLQLTLVMEFWSSLDTNTNSSFVYRIPSRGAALFKFLRHAGDMIPPTLFVPYLNLLISLSQSSQSARHCFNMLKQTTPGMNNSISWDHFFMSFNQYYTNLRQEAPPTSDTVYRHRNTFHKGITPQEIAGLQAVLKLLKTIALHDDFSRLALCEHPAWAPLNVFLGLVSCSVPIPLKADLLTALAALSKSTETASQMWNNLEISQILITIPSTSSYQPRGIQTELDEVESRMEEYPLTKAFLVLLDALTDYGIPRTLGAGPRTPGFDPYLTFIINSVFLKINSRSYKDPIEKWLISSTCLKLFLKFLLQYVPDSTDFSQTNKPSEFNSPPGFHLMLQLNTKSEFLNAILYMIDEGICLFDTYTNFPGQKQVEQSVLYCLNIIERGLSLQQKFSELMTSTPCPVLLTSLNKLLLSINIRTGKPDHVLNISKYICHQTTLPSHSLVAVKILIHLTKSTKIHSQIVNILLTTVEVNKDIRSGFVECLDAPLDDEHFSSEIKESIFKLLKQCLPYTSPNLSHFLFGFDIVRDVNQTVFQLPGIMDFPRTCIHSLLGILRSAVQKLQMKQSLIDAAYNLLYALASNSKTSGPVLKFLRLQPNFFDEHINACMECISNSYHELNQFSWLLRILAIEVKVSSRANQMIYLKNLVYLLHGIDPKVSSVVDPFSLLVNNTDNENGEYIIAGSKNLLINLIATFDLNIKEVSAPHWDYFNTNVVDGLLNSCQNDGKPKLIDVKKLHKVLLEELGNLQNTTVMGQKQAVLQEVQKVLLHAITINSIRSSSASILQFIDAWRQLAEVLVIYIPYEVIPPKQQQLLILSILESLLKKVTNCNMLLEVSNYLSGSVLIMFENLRRAYIKESKQLKLHPSNSEITTLKQNASTIKVIIDRTIQWLLNADVTAQKLRVNLYGSLVSALHLIAEENSQEAAQSQLEDNLFISRLDSSKYKAHIQSIISYDLFALYGEKLMEVLCHDCISGQEVCKMLAMACFSLIIKSGTDIHWISYISRRGFLKHIIDRILNSDTELKAVLEPVPDNLRPLYAYESKMSMLSVIATSKIGAENLLEQRLLACLSSMKVFDGHPHISKEVSNINQIVKDIIEPVEIRYLHIWLPSLHTCSAILTSLGTDNQSAVCQIMYFLLSHLEVVDMILRSGHPTLPLSSLNELSLLTSVIARTANNDLISVLDSHSANHDNRAHLFRIQKLMLNMLPKFLLSENTIRELLSDTDFNENPKTNRLLCNLKIVANLLLYSRNTVANHGIDHAGVGVVFQPHLKDALNHYNNKQPKNFNENAPSLGVLVQHLIYAVNHYHKEKFTLEYLNRRLCEVSTMNTVDLKEIVTMPQQQYDLHIMRENALGILNERIKSKKLELDYCIFTIDHSLYIIWTHLDYYMLKAIPRAKNFGLLDYNSSFNLDTTLASGSEAMWKVSTDDISNLKQGLVSIFNDSFSKQLLETAYDRSDADKNLLEVLLRKIKRLIKFVPVK